MYPFDGFDAVEVWNGPWSSDLHGLPRITARRWTGHRGVAHQRQGISVRQGRGSPLRQHMAALTNPVILF